VRQESAVEETTLAQRRTALTIARLNLDKLGTVDLRDFQQKVRLAQASATYASDFFARQSDLLAQKSIPQVVYDQAKRDKELAEAALAGATNQLRSAETTLKTLSELQISQAENDLRRAEIDLRDTVLRAPLDGRIVEHEAHKGEFVAGGRKVITFIPASSRTYLEVQVDEASLGRLALGQKAVVSSPAFPDRKFPAVVERIAPIVDTLRGTFALRLIMDALYEELLPESSISVQIVVGESKASLLLEQRFLVREGPLAFAFTAVDGKARRTAVTVEDLGNGRFGVRSGLKAGDVVLLPRGLKDGARVKPVSAAE
jgi:HlyD family secretion protein